MDFPLESPEAVHTRDQMYIFIHNINPICIYKPVSVAISI